MPRASLEGLRLDKSRPHTKFASTQASNASNICACICHPAVVLGRRTRAPTLPGGTAAAWRGVSVLQGRCRASCSSPSVGIIRATRQ